jgi:hypothetical protein
MPYLYCTNVQDRREYETNQGLATSACVEKLAPCGVIRQIYPAAAPAAIRAITRQESSRVLSGTAEETPWHDKDLRSRRETCYPA